MSKQFQKLSQLVCFHTVSIFIFLSFNFVIWLESHASKSAASVKSHMSMKSRIADEKKREARKKAEWDASTTTSK